MQQNRIRPGDVFSVDTPIGNVHARILNLADGWDIAECLPPEQSSQAEAQGASGAFYPPFHFDIRDIESGALMVVGHLALSSDDHDYINELRFKQGRPGRWEIMRVNSYTPEAILKEAPPDLPTRRFFALEGMVVAVKKIIAQGFRKATWLELKSQGTHAGRQKT